MEHLITILGGDARQISLAAHLARMGIKVRVFALPEERMLPCVTVCKDWSSAVLDAKAVLLPLPASPDGRIVHAPLTPLVPPIRLEELFDELADGCFIAGGRFSPSVKAMAQARGRELFDYSVSESFQIANAVPTAEGAVAILMERIPRTVRGLSVAITGYGRVGRALAALLLSMGARVTVGARKFDALLQARAAGCDTVRLCGDESVIALTEGNSVVFNTVPHWLFSKNVLGSIAGDTLLIDLASSPGGVDIEAAGEAGISVVWALSLPGKYAPVTAGEIIADTVLSHMREEGII